MPTVDDDFVDLELTDILDDELDAEHRGMVRRVKLKNGNTIWLKCVDPHGFWKVSLSKGRLPESIQKNSYTTFRNALTDVNRWLRTVKYPIVYPEIKG